MRLLRANRRESCAAVFGLALALPFALAEPARAAPTLFDQILAFGQALNRQEVTSLALTLGILLFAVVTAIGLLRSRTGAASERAEARREIARLRAEADRMTALLLSEPQVVVIWRSLTAEPAVLGDVATISGLDSSRRILAFGTWLGAEPAAAMDAAVDALRKRGKAFGFSILTPRGKHVEAEGRPVGGVAVLRLRDVTGAKRDHAAVAVKHKQLEDEIELVRNLLELMPAPIWIRDAEGKIVFANRAYAGAVEVADPDEATARNLELLDQPIRAEAAQAREQNAVFHRRVGAIVAGKRRTVEVFEAGSKRGAAGIALDVTEAEIARSEISRITEAHRRTLDQMPTAVAIFGSDRRLIFYNSAYLSLFKLDPAFLEEMPDDAMVLDRLRAQRCLPEMADFRTFKTQLHEAYASVDPKHTMWHLADGRSLRVALSPNAQGGVTYLFDDVSEGYALASRFSSLENTQGETLDALAEAVAVFGVDGRLQLQNQAFQNLWRFSDIDLAEKPPVDAIRRLCRAVEPQSNEVWTEIERAVTSSGERRPVSQRLELADGRSFDCAVVPLPDGGNLVTFRDITDTVRAERILRERNAALIAADAIRDTVIRYISHDLRSPLNNISGYTQFLGTTEAGPLSEKQREYLGHISSSSAELLAIIDGLQLAILDAGGKNMPVAQVEICKLLDAVTANTKTKLAEKQLSLVVDVPAGIGAFSADEERVRQVLQNLVVNAAAHSPRGESIGLAVERRQQAVLFHVSDRGPGIPRDVQERLFQNLETLPIDSTHRGAGLGLSLVRSAMKLQGGDVMIDSGANRGTVITCVFPLTPPETKNSPTPTT
ncbi:MAG: PAS-domain containing protein [Xanthobacteraceae bacterium]|nr:PAS-domain containing protein [Xanthobacteraceae bacterium]